MKYAVQYAHNRFGTTIVEDTNPISYEEAIALFEKHKEDFFRRLRNGDEPIFVIWKDVGDGEFPIYSEELLELDARDNLTVVGDKVYKTVTQEIELPPHQKNET